MSFHPVIGPIWTGAAGLKTTFGRISLDGVWPLAAGPGAVGRGRAAPCLPGRR
jgi:hypothetical protein